MDEESLRTNAERLSSCTYFYYLRGWLPLRPYVPQRNKPAGLNATPHWPHLPYMMYVHASKLDSIWVAPCNVWLPLIVPLFAATARRAALQLFGMSADQFQASQLQHLREGND